MSNLTLSAKPKPNKLLLVPQICQFDQEQGYALVNLICDLIEDHCLEADIMLSIAVGAKEDAATIERLRSKFSNVYVHHCRNEVKGWPYGPNNQVCEVFNEVFSGHRDRKWNYAAFMLIEPDCVPTKKDWIQVLHKEWHEGTQLALGAWLCAGDSDCGIEHINGNMLISPDIIKSEKSLRRPSFNAWDINFARIFLNSGRASRFIWSDYRLGTPSNPWTSCKDFLGVKQYKSGQNPLYGQKLSPVWIHGVKTKEAIDCVRAKLLK
jgi:hypothetical protein